MSAIDTEPVTQPAIAERIALVRSQLAPIRSRRALLDSYRRESLYRLASTAQTAGSAADVLEMAYALRWVELGHETQAPEPDDGPCSGTLDG
jgi:hypothetical protein